jgi:hypothetical protein
VSRTIEFTDRELNALRKMFPRHLVVGAVEGPDTPLATALYKISPTILPFTVASEIKHSRTCVECGLEMDTPELGSLRGPKHFECRD